MSEKTILIAIKNGFIWLGSDRWTRLNDPLLYDNADVLLWLAARRLLPLDKAKESNQ